MGRRGKNTKDSLSKGRQEKKTKEVMMMTDIKIKKDRNILKLMPISNIKRN